MASHGPHMKRLVLAGFVFCAACSGVHAKGPAPHLAGRDAVEDAGSAGIGDDADPADAGATQEPATSSICDGSARVRLKYELVVRASGGVDNGRDLMYDNYFIVRGDCSYWILLDGWREARTGTLSAADAAQLSAALHYDAWAELSGAYGPSEPTFDVSTQRLTDGTAELFCTGLCSSPNDQVHRIVVAAESIMQQRYAVGRAVNGPMRVTGLIYRNGPWPNNYQAIDWPLTAQGIEYFYDPARQTSANEGVLVTDLDALSTLRELRRRKQDPQFIWSEVAYIPVTAAPGTANSSVELYFRDVTPVED